MRPVKLTLALIVQDEKKWVEQCLGFMKKLADRVRGGKVQILVIDGYSVDGTWGKIKKLKDRRFDIYRRKWKGFADQLNHVNSLSKGKWIFPFAADVVLDDNIFYKINKFMNVGLKIKSYSFPQLNLVKDRDHASETIEWITMLRRNDPKFVWVGKNNSLENLSYRGKIIQQHPYHFNFRWQRKVSDVFIIHFASLKSKDELFAKFNKRRKIKKSFYYKMKKADLHDKVYNSKVEIIGKPIKDLIRREISFYGKDYK